MLQAYDKKFIIQVYNNENRKKGGLFYTRLTVCLSVLTLI